MKTFLEKPRRGRIPGCSAGFKERGCQQDCGVYLVGPMTAVGSVGSEVDSVGVALMPSSAPPPSGAGAGRAAVAASLLPLPLLLLLLLPAERVSTCRLKLEAADALTLLAVEVEVEEAVVVVLVEGGTTAICCGGTNDVFCIIACPCPCPWSCA